MANLTQKEFAEILDACKRAGVTKLRFRGISAEFGQGNAPDTRSPAQNSLTTPPRPASLDPDLLDRREQSAAEALKRDTEELLLTDPEAYEDMLGQRELEDDGPKNGEDDEDSA